MALSRLRGPVKEISKSHAPSFLRARFLSSSSSSSRSLSRYTLSLSLLKFIFYLFWTVWIGEMLLRIIAYDRTCYWCESVIGLWKVLCTLLKALSLTYINDWPIFLFYFNVLQILFGEFLCCGEFRYQLRR